jgi:Tfp pilus assembly protein PilO
MFKNMPELELDKSKKKVLLVYVLSVLFVIAFFFYFFLGPAIAKLFDVLPKVRALSMEIKMAEEDFQFEEKLKRKLGSLNEKMTGYGNRLSREKEIPMLLESLSRLARKSRVRILSITPFQKRLKEQEKGEKESVYQEVPIAVSAQSAYHDLGTFINKLENDERFMKITDMEIKANRTNAKRHDIDFVVYAYTFKGE